MSKKKEEGETAVFTTALCALRWDTNESGEAHTHTNTQTQTNTRAHTHNALARTTQGHTHTHTLPGYLGALTHALVAVNQTTRHTHTHTGSHAPHTSAQR